jgi:hypothetical protein
MRTRAYQPEVPTRLEDRSLLSGVARVSGHPVVLSHRKFTLVAEHMSMGFDVFTRYRDLSQLHNEIDDVVLLIPFERVDGLRVSINRIVSRMQHDLSAHVPHAIRSAKTDVLGVTRAEVVARVQTGDVVMR